MESITRIALLFYQRTGFEGHELRTAGRTRLALQLGEHQSSVGNPVEIELNG